MESIFWGYPEQPKTTPETISTTAAELAHTFESIRWEELATSGRVIMDEVLSAIDTADYAIFDITRPNQNVLFEAGYAIGSAKPTWLILDSTVSGAKAAWKELGLLQPIGYETYKNSHDLAQRILKNDALLHTPPVYDKIIEPMLPERSAQTALFYFPTYEPFEASNRLSQLVEEHRLKGLEVLLSDPTESSLNPITWVAPKIVASAGVLINFAGGQRNRSLVINQRNSFIAGLAVGLDIPVLLLAEEDYARPFDYQDRLRVYETAAACVREARGWLDGLSIEKVRISSGPALRRSPLSGLRLGEHVAENERTELDEYFIPTSAYQAVVAARDALFVGHRGTGKTANALQAFEELSSNKENMAVLIKPAGFEFPGLLAAIARLPEFTHEYLFDTLWRFLIQTELAREAIIRIERRPSYVPIDAEEQALLDYADSAPFQIDADISSRLDQALTSLMAQATEDLTVDSGRVLINEAFHEKSLNELRHVIGPVLRDRRRVAVLIDNLDKGWQRSANLSVLAQLILGLMSARGRIVTDMAKQDWWREQIKFTIAIFLRSDIYTYVRREAREPDKLDVSSISWRDPEILKEVVTARAEVALSDRRPQPDFWKDIFPASIGTIATWDFIVSLVQPRPRDVVYLCNAAIARAADRGHDRVAPEDLLAAEATYSMYAYEALLVENGITIPEMESVLYAFLGSPQIVTRRDASTLIASAGVPDERIPSVILRLVEMGFLKIEVRPSEFVAPEVGTELARALVMAGKLATDDAQRMEIHPAFHKFLEIQS